MKNITKVLSLLVFTLLLALPVHAASIKEGTYNIMSPSNISYWVDVENQSKISNAKIVLTKKDSTKSQKWKLIPRSKADTYAIQNVNSNRYLGVSGSNFIQKSASTVFIIKPYTTNDRYTIQLYSTKQYLSISGNKLVLGTSKKPFMFKDVNEPYKYVSWNTTIYIDRDVPEAERERYLKIINSLPGPLRKNVSDVHIVNSRERMIEGQKYYYHPNMVSDYILGFTVQQSVNKYSAKNLPYPTDPNRCAVYILNRSGSQWFVGEQWDNKDNLIHEFAHAMDLSYSTKSKEKWYSDLPAWMNIKSEWIKLGCSFQSGAESFAESVAAYICGRGRLNGYPKTKALVEKALKNIDTYDLNDQRNPWR